MKVGVIGYKGFVGSAFYELFSSDGKYETLGIGKEEYPKLVGGHFDILINANGNSSKPLAERDPKKDFDMNVVSTFSCLHDFKCDYYVHISTGEVYSRKDSPEFTREDAQIEPERLSNYGMSKYLGELVARKYAKKWLILRLGGMVGKNMKKGPVFDILNLKKLFLSSHSRLQFLNTSEVASIAKKLVEKGKCGETYNVVADGNMELAEIARMARVELTSEGESVVNLNVSCEKAKKELGISTTQAAIKAFLSSRD